MWKNRESHSLILFPSDRTSSPTPRRKLKLTLMMPNSFRSLYIYTYIDTYIRMYFTRQSDSKGLTDDLQVFANNLKHFRHTYIHINIKKCK